MPSLPTQFWLSVSGPAGGVPEPCAEQELATVGRGREIRDRDPAVGRALDLGVAVDELDVLGRGLHLLGSQLAQLLADLAGGADDGAAVVDQRLRAGRAHVPGPASVS